MTKTKETTDVSSAESDIGALVRVAEDNYIHGQTNISKYVSKSMYEDINLIDAYLNSKHQSGLNDSQGREKPFFNIVTSAVNIWYRATDIDRSHIKIRPTKSEDFVSAFLASVMVQDWMRRDNFGYFLNDWGRTLARYGSSVVKFVEKDKQLHCMVVPWQRLIVDAVDFDNNIKIEILELTEAQLYQRKGYDKKQIERLCDAKTSRENTGGDKKDNKSDYIKLYEVHGFLPKSYLTGLEKDEDVYVQQMHVISYLEGKEQGKFDDYTLYFGEEEQDPYMITHLIKEDGQTLSIGAVQHLFDAQWMMNHTVKTIKDQLDLASKLVFQTSDPTFVGQNALTALETGDILIHKPNEPLTQVNNSSHDITSAQSFGSMWKGLSDEIVGVSQSMRGETAPSGTAWRQVEALLSENHSLFELMRENKGLSIEEMIRKFVLPFIKKQYLNTSKQITAVLESYDLTRIDNMYIKNVAIKAVKKKILNDILNVGLTPVSGDQDSLVKQTQTDIRESLAVLGNQRFFKPSQLNDKKWKEVLKDLEWDVEVDVTGESSTANDDVVTLTTVLQTLADPVKAQILQTPQGKLVFNRILAKAGGVSPLELSVLPPPSVPAQPVT